MTPFHHLVRTPFVLLACSFVYGCPGGNESNDLFLSEADGGSTLTPDSEEASSLPTSRPDETFKLNHVEHEDKCARTAEDRCEDCERDQRVRVNDCWDTCRYADSGSTYERCASICRDLNRADRCDYECGEAEENACWERSYAFTVVGEPDADIQSACEAAVERDSDCDEENVGSECELAATVERPAVIAVYECVAATPCGEPVEHCYDSLGQREFAKEVASACEQDWVSEDMVSLLDMAGVWLLPTALDDVAICERVCGTGDYGECVEEWFWAVVGE